MQPIRSCLSENAEFYPKTGVGVLGLRGRVWGAGGHRGGLREKLLGVSSTSGTANSSWLQDGAAAGQGWSSPFLRDWPLGERPTLEPFVESCFPWDGLRLEKFLEKVGEVPAELSPLGGTDGAAGEGPRLRSPSSSGNNVG